MAQMAILGKIFMFMSVCTETPDTMIFVSGRSRQPVIPEIHEKVPWETQLLITSCVIANASRKSTSLNHLLGLLLIFYSHPVIRLFLNICVYLMTIY